MLGNFAYSNPTKLYFGEDCLRYLNEELPKYGKTVQLIYGSGSIKKTGIYDQVIEILKANDKTIVEDGGAVITNHEQKLKIGHVFGDNVMPKFSILNPKFTFTLPKHQMTAGIYDIFNHICEQYFSGEDDNTSDYISEALMKSVIHSSRIALRDPEDYEARSNIMWTATWALNTLIAKGKTTDWMVHMLGQAVGAYTDATHGMTLAAVSLAYYRYICPYGLAKFRRFAVNVWNVDENGKTDEQIAAEGLACMESWMKELGLVMNLRDLGVSEDMLEGIADGTHIMEGGYKVLTRDEVLDILKASM